LYSLIFVFLISFCANHILPPKPQIPLNQALLAILLLLPLALGGLGIILSMHREKVHKMEGKILLIEKSFRMLFVVLSWYAYIHFFSSIGKYLFAFLITPFQTQIATNVINNALIGGIV